MPEVNTETEGFLMTTNCLQPISRAQDCLSKPHPAPHLKPTFPHKTVFQAICSSGFSYSTSSPRLLCPPSPKPLHPASPGILFCVLPLLLDSHRKGPSHFPAKCMWICPLHLQHSITSVSHRNTAAQLCF